MRNNEFKNDINDIKKWEEKIEPVDLKFEVGKYIFDFQQYATIRSFDESIYTGKINVDKDGSHQTNLLENVNFNHKSRPKSEEDKLKKKFL